MVLAPGKNLSLLETSKLIGAINAKILHKAVLELTAGLGLGDIAKRCREDLALKKGLGLRDGLEEQSVPFVGVSPEDLQPEWLGATVGLEERGVINLAAVDGLEIRHAPAASLLLQREGATWLDGLG